MTTSNTAPTTTRRNVHELMLDTTIESGRELFANAARLLRDYAAEMDRYAERYDACATDESTKHEDVLSWAVNHVACLQSNLRLDLFVSRAAQIAQRRMQVKSRPDDE